jgi:alpha-tubulin suppressor-like RCC1 family protein
LAPLGFAFGLALLSCGRDVTSPGAAVRIAHGLSFNTQFPPAFQALGNGASTVVPFNRVHVVLHHSDVTVALDTTIDFPAGADSITVNLTVKLLDNAPPSGEPMTLNLGYLNAAGDTVFKGGPVSVTASPPPAGGGSNPPVQVPVTYTGPGANAVGVQISPRSGTAVSGSTFSFTAVAVDGSGNTIPNTPIIWNTLDPSIASIPSAAAGNVLAGNVRGSARIVAQLLTGPTDQVTLNVLLPAATIALQSGSGQSGLVGSTLANPLVALVTAADGFGVSGVTVTFAVASGGGSVGTATVVTDGAGLAQTTWKLGSTVGTQTVTASSGTLTGSPVTFTATARSLAPTKLAVTAQPANATAGATLATVTIVALTAAGDTASAFTGAVSLALAGGTSGAALGGTSTVNAVAGMATFSGLTVNKPGTGYSLVASSAGLSSATTSSFDVAAGAATRLAFTSQPATSTAGQPVGSIAVTALDSLGNTATGFTGLVSLALASNPGAATLSGVTSTAAVAGVATFGSVTLNKPGSGYTLSASASGLTSATSAPFNVQTGPAASLVLSSGGGQSAYTSAALAQPVIVRVMDAVGNPVFGATVNFAVVTGGGSVSPANGTSSSSGLVQTTWTLGATAGAQAMTATIAGVPGSSLGISATAVPAPVATVAVTPAAPSIAVGASVQLATTLKDVAGTLLTGRVVTWTSSNAAITTVSSKGLLTATGLGVDTITATSEGMSGTAVATTTVTFVSLSLGRDHTCGLTVGGTGYCWGLNDIGRLGDGSYGGPVGGSLGSVPTAIAVAGGHAFTQITSADVHSCGLATGGAAFCWGPNYSGNLGTGDTLSTATPRAVTGGIAFTVLSAGGNLPAFSCGLTSVGAAYCWGWGFENTVAGVALRNFTPVAVDGGHAFSQLSSGERFVCGLTPAGTAYCWGNNASGAFGNGTVVDSTATPVAAGGGLIFSKITAGSAHTCGLTSAGIAYCWGGNASGQLGNGTTVASLVPVAVTGGLTFADLDAGGGNSTCGVTGGGAAYCWGDNTHGAVGDGTNTNRSVPTPVSGGLLFSIVRESRFWHACGITTSGTTYCWGYNAFGQLGNGGYSVVSQDDHDSAVPVKVSGQP